MGGDNCNFGTFPCLALEKRKRYIENQNKGGECENGRI